MFNPFAVLQLIAVIVVLGVGVFFSWDQIAYSMQWPRPTVGAGIGAMFMAVLINFFTANKLVIGRTHADYHDSDTSETPTQSGDSGGPEVRKD